jgi:hypothetical protein
VALVPGEGEAPGWASTIGLLERFGHPEIALFGMHLAQMHPLLNRLGIGVRRGERYEADRTYAGVLAGHAGAFRAVHPRWIDPFFGNTAWHYRRPDVPIVQCFWPDARGRFPFEPEFDPAWRGAQPLLYLSDVEQALPRALQVSLRTENALL